jgi:hypothetical protein
MPWLRAYSSVIPCTFVAVCFDTVVPSLGDLFTQLRRCIMCYVFARSHMTVVHLFLQHNLLYENPTFEISYTTVIPRNATHVRFWTS